MPAADHPADQPAADEPTQRGSGAPVVIHWRPGCGFCSALLAGADEAGLQYEARNIWEDEGAAAFVRSVADGNETVPTVRVGDVALVNPTTRQLLEAVAEHAPDALPEDDEPHR